MPASRSRFFRVLDPLNVIEPDVLYVFDASHLQQEMIYRRHGGEREIDPRRTPLMRKALGL